MHLVSLTDLLGNLTSGARFVSFNGRHTKNGTTQPTCKRQHQGVELRLLRTSCAHARRPHWIRGSQQLPDRMLLALETAIYCNTAQPGWLHFTSSLCRSGGVECDSSQVLALKEGRGLCLPCLVRGRQTMKTPCDRDIDGDDGVRATDRKSVV